MYYFAVIAHVKEELFPHFEICILLVYMHYSAIIANVKEESYPHFEICILLMYMYIFTTIASQYQSEISFLAF